MVANSEASTQAPITRLPDDVLREIFWWSSPQYPLEIPQPNTGIAPMILCHVCMSWRTVAFASATLWSHMRCLVSPTKEVDNDNEEEDNSCWIFPLSQIQFIQWWKSKQGSIAPFIHLSVTRSGDNGRGERQQAVGGMAVILDYLTSAQYLELDAFFWDRVEDMIRSEHQAVFRQLRTIGRSFDRTTYGFGRRFYRIQSLLSHPQLPLLHRLSIQSDKLPGDMLLPTHWSSLTHISLRHVGIHLRLWFSLIRFVSNLQWGCFDIEVLSGVDMEANPPLCTHSQLSFLFLDVNSHDGQPEEDFRLSLLLRGLHLPALHTLLLPSFPMYFTDEPNATDLDDIFVSAPSLKSLTLGARMFFISEDMMEAVDTMQPIWRRVPTLEHLCLERPPEIVKSPQMIFPPDNFSQNRWLDLENHTYPARTLTIISPKNNDVVASCKAFIAPNFTIQLTTESISKRTKEAYREWGSRI